MSANDINSNFVRSVLCMCFLRQPAGNGITETTTRSLLGKRYRETKKIENLALQRRVIEQRVQFFCIV